MDLVVEMQQKCSGTMSGPREADSHVTGNNVCSETPGNGKAGLDRILLLLSTRL